jgi:hypothetical protein
MTSRSSTFQGTGVMAYRTILRSLYRLYVVWSKQLNTAEASGTVGILSALEIPTKRHTFHSSIPWI